MARLIGDVYFNVYPDTNKFLPELEAAVKKATTATRGQVAVKPVLDQAAIAVVEAQLKSLGGAINLGIAVNQAELAAAQAKLKTLTGQVDFFVDPAKLAADAAAVKAALGQAYAPIEIRTTVSQKDLGDTMFTIQNAFAINPAKVAVKPVVDVSSEAAVRAATAAYFAANPIPLRFSISAASLAAAAAGIAAVNSAVSKTPLPDWGAAIAGALTYRAALSGIGDTMTTIAVRNAAVNALIGSSKSIWVSFLDVANAGWANMGVKVDLFAGVLNNVLPKMLSTVSVGHLLIDWVIEFAAVLGPAILAVGAFGAAVAPVVSDAVLRFQVMNQAASALGVSIGKVGSGAGASTGPLQALQNALQPTVWELTGDAINVMNARAGTFSTVVKAVNGVVQQLAARMTAAFTSPGFNDFMKNGALDAQRFGDILGNLGGAFGNIAKAVPGYAEIIQQFFVTLTAGIEKVTSLTIPLMNLVMAFHGFILYTGLAVTAGVAFVAGIGNVTAKMFTFAANAIVLTGEGGILAKIGTAFTNAGTAIAAFGKNLLALAVNPYVIALAALGAAVYELVINWNSASASVAGFTRSLTQMIATAQGGTALQEIPTALGAISAQIKLASSPAAYQQLAANWNNLSNTGNAFAKDTQADFQQWGAAFSGLSKLFTTDSGSWASTLAHLGDAIKGVFVPGAGVFEQVKANVNDLQNAFNKLMDQNRNLLITVGDLMQGTVKIPGTFQNVTTATFSWAQSLGILNAAGVLASDTLATMQVKVSGFLQGWAAFGLNASQIGNSVNALALQAEMGQTSISKLTGAYSNFISVVTGGETAFASFGTGLSTLSSALSSANTTGVTFHDTLGKFSVTGTSVGATLNGISQASLNARSAFAQETTNAQNLYNSLLTMSSVSAQGAHGQDLLAQSMKDMVAELLPLAKNSPQALAQLSALAQVAGGPATDSFKQLSQWVGNTKNPMQDLNNIEQQLTKASANLLQDTLNLAGAMNQTLTTAISNAILAAKGGPQVLNSLATAMNNFATGVKGTDVKSLTADIAKAIPTLVLMTGSTSNAKDQFLAMAAALHISTPEANAMWAAAQKLAPSLTTTAGASAALTKAQNDLTNAMLTSNGAATTSVTTLSGKYYEALLQAGTGATTAMGDVDAFLTKLGATPAVVDQVNAALARLPKQVNIGVNVQVAVNNQIAAGGATNAVRNAIVAGFEAGGIVHAARGYTVPPKAGSAAGKDSQLIVAAPGELVIPTSHAPMFGDMARRSGIPGFDSGGIPYSYGAGFSSYVPMATGGGVMPGMTQYQGAAIVNALNTLIKLGQQQPFAYAQALTQANATGVRRGWFATSG